MKEAFTVDKSITMEEVAAEQSACDPVKVLNVDSDTFLLTLSNLLLVSISLVPNEY